MSFSGLGDGSAFSDGQLCRGSKRSREAYENFLIKVRPLSMGH